MLIISTTTRKKYEYLCFYSKIVLSKKEKTKEANDSKNVLQSMKGHRSIQAAGI